MTISLLRILTWSFWATLKISTVLLTYSPAILTRIVALVEVAVCALTLRTPASAAAWELLWLLRGLPRSNHIRNSLMRELFNSLPNLFATG